MNLPKISIITPSYNQGQFLEKTILSVINQSYANLEYIIMDGGSTDNSVAIIKKYEKHLTYWQSKPDGGQSAAINEGFRHATGEIFAWLNSDDQYLSETLKFVGEYFAKNKKCMWLAGEGNLVDSKENIILKVVPGKLEFEALCDWKNYEIFQPSVFWKRELWDMVGGVDSKLKNAMDFDLWLKFSQQSIGNIVSSSLSQAYYHKDMKTQKNAHLSFVEFNLILAKYGKFDLAREQLCRVVKRAYEADRFFSFITKNGLYRKWRDSRENKLKKK